MKVLHVIPSVSPGRGGPSEAVLAMCRASVAAGLEAEVLTTNDDGSTVLDVPTGSFIDHRGVRVCFLPRWSPPVNALREFQASWGLSAWLEEHLADYDCVHVHAVFSFMSTVTMRVARRLGKPYVARPLGQLDVWSLQQKALKKKLYFQCFERANLEGAAAIHCTSESEAKNVKALLPAAQVAVIPHGVAAPVEPANARGQIREAYGVPDDEPVILFLSRWVLKKNIPVLLRALRHLKDLRWTLVLAGKGEEASFEESVRKCIAELGIEERVRCPGHVSGEAKAALLYGSDLFVLPSESENFGIAVAEALVCGLPALVSPGVDLAPAVRDLAGGEVCEANEEALSAALRRCLSAPRDRQRLAAAARERFAWAASVVKLQELYATMAPLSSC